MNVGISRLVVVQNTLLVPIIEMSMRVFGWKRVWKIMAVFTRQKPHPPEPDSIVQTHFLSLKRVRKVSPLPGRCLARSLVLWWQLRRHGIPATLVIGVRKRNNFRAHAWIEYGKKPLNAGVRVRERYSSILSLQHPDDLT